MLGYFLHAFTIQFTQPNLQAVPVPLVAFPTVPALPHLRGIAWTDQSTAEFNLQRSPPHHSAKGHDSNSHANTVCPQIMGSTGVPAWIECYLSGAAKSRHYMIQPLLS